MFATLTSRGRTIRYALGAAISIAALGAAAFAVLAVPTAGPALAVRDFACANPADALTKGLDAYQKNRYELALPAFECALSQGNDLQQLHANFYLGRIYSDDTGGFTDHARAYDIFRSISDGVDTVDPDDTRRAPFVAKALTAFAGYVHRGLPEIGLKPDLSRTVEYIRHAATFFDEPDAQFELAKMHLTGQGVPLDVPLGLHYIQKLVQNGHAGAQAYLADLYWHGTHVPADHVRALALIRTAASNAAAADRLWIEDNYQNIFCGTRPDERAKAANLSEVYRSGYGHGLSAGHGTQVQPGDQPMGLGRRAPALARRCSNGEPIDMELHGSLDMAPFASSLAPSGLRQTTPAGILQTPRP